MIETIGDNSRKLMLDLLRREGLLDAAAAAEIESRCAAAEAGQDAPDFLDLLAPAVGLDRGALVDRLAAELGMARARLTGGREDVPAADFAGGFPARVLLRYRMLPLRCEGEQLLVAVCDPLDARGLEELRMLCGRRCRPLLAAAAEIEALLAELLGVGAETLEVLARSQDGPAGGADASAVELEAAAGDPSIITFVNQILSEAIERRATDVHIEPFEKSLRVRYRIDGMLHETPVPREVHKFHSAIISRLKILGQLDIAEKRLPQDGRVLLRVGQREIDVRISVIPMLHGEAMVLRLLDRGSALLGLEQLGAGVDDLRVIDRALALPHGIVLVTGPTGSGKTTTLYAALSRINDVQRKIVTIEDPVEYHLYGINQIPVSTRTGLGFARGLRAILRHDPDIVLIGEIRDGETAEIAVQASLTGHLVFSTLHTNDAPSAAMRLVDMGIEPYLVASTLEVVVAQRLVRTVCPHCREAYVPHDIDSLLAEFGGRAPETFYHGAGCAQCGGSGFLGRRGIFEIMPISEALGAMILQRHSAGELRRQAIAEGMRTLREDGWRLVCEGLTTAEEVMRLTRGDSPARSEGS